MSDDRPWLPLASRAWRAQLRGDRHVAVRLIERIARDHGPDAVVYALMAWLDTLLAAQGHTQFATQGAGVAFFDEDGDGSPLTADAVPDPYVVWSGRLMAARAAGDRNQFEALIDAATSSTPQEWGNYVQTTLACAAMTYADVMAGGDAR